MENEIKLKLDEYLGFDSDELFNVEIKEYNREFSPIIRVFGGAIRDIIADKKIHDIDILIGAKTYKVVKKILEDKGYIFFENLTPKDLASTYSDIKIINEPHTFIKNDKVVQLIRPAMKVSGIIDISENVYREGFQRLIQNVDISCCGLSYDGEKLYENCKDSILHSQLCVFKVNKLAMMYNPDRFLHRKDKMLCRGWVEIKNDAHLREVIIEKMLDNDDKIQIKKRIYTKEYE